MRFCPFADWSVKKGALHPLACARGSEGVSGIRMSYRGHSEAYEPPMATQGGNRAAGDRCASGSPARQQGDNLFGKIRLSENPHPQLIAFLARYDPRVRKLYLAVRSAVLREI